MSADQFNMFYKSVQFRPNYRHCIPLLPHILILHLRSQFCPEIVISSKRHSQTDEGVQICVDASAIPGWSLLAQVSKKPRPEVWDPLAKRTVTSFVFSKSSLGTFIVPQQGPKNKAHFWHISKFGPAQRIGIWHFSLLVVKFTRQHKCNIVIITQLDFCLILRLIVNLIILTSQGEKWLTLDK